MASLLTAGESTLPGGTPAAGSSKLEEPDHSSSNWYFTREEIERNSPSRKDSIDLKRETYFRKSYCTFLQDLGMRLKVPQVTIATAIVFCHRFFLRQSHHKNDRLMIATICMFLAGKVEETPRGLVDVILMSYEIRFKKDQAAIQRIKKNQKEVVEEQKELVLVGERLVLTTLGFDLNIHHPYKPLVAAIKKFKVAQNALAQVAWNFVNDGLRTSLCLQFKPHHIAAGAIFLAAKFLKVKLPSDGEKVWWQEFDVTPRQLEEVSNQMLELYEQNKTGGLVTAGAGSRSSDPSASAGVAGNRIKAGQTCQAQSKLELLGLKAETVEEDWKALAGPEEVNQEAQIQVKTEATVVKSETVIVKAEAVEDDRKSRAGLDWKDATKDSSSHFKTDEGITGAFMVSEAVPVKTDGIDEERKPWVGLEGINTDKVKAAVARRKSRGEGGETKPKLELADDDELLQRALEGDMEMSATDTERANHERRDVKSKHGHRVEHDLPDIKKDRAEEVEHAYKRKRLEDEDMPPSDRRWPKVVENGDVREGPEELENVMKRKRNQWEELPAGDKRPPRPLDKGDSRDADVGKIEVAEVAPERGEDGELPTTSVQEPARSPRVPERRSQLSSADRSASPSSHKRRWENRETRDIKDNRDGRDTKDTRDTKENRDIRDSKDINREPKDGNRDVRDARDNRDTRETREPHRGRDAGTHEKWGVDNRSNGTAMHRHGHNRGDGYYHHSNSHQHHHGDRERYHQRDRDWQERERDYKKSRHDQGH